LLPVVAYCNFCFNNLLVDVDMVEVPPIVHMCVAWSSESIQNNFNVIKSVNCSEMSGSLSPQHGVSSGCGWRNSLQYEQ
jgi:hypothetical protein